MNLPIGKLFYFVPKIQGYQDGTGANISGTLDVTGNLTACNIITAGGNVSNVNVISALNSQSLLKSPELLVPNLHPLF